MNISEPRNVVISIPGDCGESRITFGPDIYLTDKIFRFSRRDIITLVQPLFCLGHWELGYWEFVGYSWCFLFHLIAKLHFEKPCFHICFIIDLENAQYSNAFGSYTKW